MHSIRRTFVVGVLAAFTASIVACSSDDAPGVVAPLPVATLTLTTPKSLIEVGEPLTITAVARDSRDSVLPAAVLSWAASPSAIATVNNGVVSAVNPGTVTITVMSGDITSSVTLTVEPARVASILLAGPTTSLAVPDTAIITATPRDARSATLTGIPVAWSASDSRVISVSSSGVVTAVSPGQAYVVAQAQGVRDSLRLSVAAPGAVLFIAPSDIDIPIGQQRTLVARMRTADGTVTAASGVTWSTANGAVATVSNGVVNGVAMGVATITATVGAQSSGVTARIGQSDGVYSVPSFATNVAGVIRADSIYIKALIANGPLTLISKGDIIIVDSLVAPCFPLTLNAGGKVIQNSFALIGTRGSIRNDCPTTATNSPLPPLRIEARGGYVFNGSLLKSSGDFTLTNDAGLTNAIFLGPAVDRANEACIFIGVNITQAPYADGVSGAVGTKGQDAAHVDIACRGSFRVEKSDITTNKGGNGGSGTHSLLAVGGDGGRSGTIRFRVTGDLIVAGRRLYFRIRESGSGGNAVANSSGNAGASATAIAGNAGDMGWPGRPMVEFKLLGDLLYDTQSGLNALEFGAFLAGKGGDASATSANGIDATSTQPATVSGSALAIAGHGGMVFKFDTSVLGIQQGIRPMLHLGSHGGHGGNAEAIGGRGGNGSAEFPNGAPGGDVRAEGGNGGVTLAVNADGGAPAGGGSAGSATLHGGNGGAGFSKCAPVGSGGIGGAGGRLSGFDGKPGTGQDGSVGATKTLTIDSAGIGGVGGNGTPPGAGGIAGQDATVVHGQKIVAPTSVSAGSSGQVCN